jgi:hypothetical protein
MKALVVLKPFLANDLKMGEKHLSRISVNFSMSTVIPIK